MSATPKSEMQQKQKHLTGLQSITFGITASDWRRAVHRWVSTTVLIGLACQLGCITLPHFFASLLILALMAAAPCIWDMFRNRKQFEINFTEDVYYIESGQWPGVEVTGGRLSDISHFLMTKDPTPSESPSSYAIFIEFHPEVYREPYRVDGLYWSAPITPHLGTTIVPSPDPVTALVLYLELAERLDVPIYDISGWNAGLTGIIEPRAIVIQPGETHPVLSELSKPRKPPIWNKW